MGWGEGRRKRDPRRETKSGIILPTYGQLSVTLSPPFAHLWTIRYPLQILLLTAFAVASMSIGDDDEDDNKTVDVELVLEGGGHESMKVRDARTWAREENGGYK